MKKKEYVTPKVKVVKIYQHLMFVTSGLEDFDGYGGESTEDDEAD